MSRESTKYRKLALFVVFLLIFLTFVPPSQEFSFGWGGDDDDSGGGGGGKSTEASTATSGREARKQLKRHLVEKKHKFHKIERIIPEDEENDDEQGNGEDDDTGNDNDSVNVEDRGDSNAAEEEEDDEDATNEQEEDEEDTGGADVSRKERAASMRSANNDDEEEEYRFKKARKAEKPARASKKSSSAESQEKTGSWFSSLFGKSEPAETTSSKQEDSAEDATSKSNSIIDWILWLGERTGRLRPDSAEDASAPEPESSCENWMDYLNRWPFNSLFPIGKPPKPIKMPKVAKKPSKDISKADEGSEEPMSQESFDNLLHNLPNFIVKPHEVQDPECREQLQIFQRQLRGHKLWTLQSKFKLMVKCNKFIENKL